MRHPGIVLTHRELLEEVKGANYGDQSQDVRVYLGQLRQKSETDPARPRFLLTEPGVRYRLKANPPLATPRPCRGSNVPSNKRAGASWRWLAGPRSKSLKSRWWALIGVGLRRLISVLRLDFWFRRSCGSARNGTSCRFAANSLRTEHSALYRAIFQRPPQAGCVPGAAHPARHVSSWPSSAQRGAVSNPGR
ncbi:MAG: winged helix-turn-helix domain-containing protein [Gemmatimonadales bacterium]|nr:winged helix-turn-helix domain-containing protein [Gemmatimonadales bacterium]